MIEHDGHAAVDQNFERGPVGSLQHGGREHIDRRSISNYRFVQTHNSRKVGGETVEIMGRENDGEAFLIEVGEEMKNLVAGAHVDTRRWLIQNE